MTMRCDRTRIGRDNANTKNLRPCRPSSERMRLLQFTRKLSFRRPLSGSVDHKIMPSGAMMPRYDNALLMMSVVHLVLLVYRPTDPARGPVDETNYASPFHLVG